jgi:hypothetical protein
MNVRYWAAFTVAFGIIISLENIWGIPPESMKQGDSHCPIKIEIVQDNFASFVNSRHPGNRIGNRFFEHTPLEFGLVPENIAHTEIDSIFVEKLENEYSNHSNTIHYQHIIKDLENWVDQIWTFYMVPAKDGVNLIWLIETKDKGLPEYYGVQQCFRLGGKSNVEWRRKIAETAAFSEYDLWETESTKKHKTSLTAVIRNNQWQLFPAIESCVGARTPLGAKIDQYRFGNNLPDRIGPYEAEMLEVIDCGLIVRSDKEEKWVTGLFWENTSHVTVHHPADCLHAIVNIGNIPAYTKRAIQGKIYWFEGKKSDLLQRWQKEFPQ